MLSNWGVRKKDITANCLALFNAKLFAFRDPVDKVARLRTVDCGDSDSGASKTLCLAGAILRVQ
jgi:hypothetical protein